MLICREEKTSAGQKGGGRQEGRREHDVIRAWNEHWRELRMDKDREKQEGETRKIKRMSDRQRSVAQRSEQSG